MDLMTKQAIRNCYKKRAKNYDVSANLYYLVGFREWKYRERAVASLALKPGATVVDLYCGTGLNFSLLQEVVGPHGNIIGVDMTTEMLNVAQNRILQNGWSNVSLVQSDVSEYTFPESVDGILSTFGLTLSPEFDEVIRKGSQALRSGGRWVVLDFRLPQNWPSWIIRVAAFITRPFAVQIELQERHPWESLRHWLDNVSMEEYYFGAAYVASGQKRDPACRSESDASGGNVMNLESEVHHEM